MNLSAMNVEASAIKTRKSTIYTSSTTKFPCLCVLTTTLTVLSSGFARTGRCHLHHAARQHQHRRQAFRDLRCRPVAATRRAVGRKGDVTHAASCSHLPSERLPCTCLPPPSRGSATTCGFASISIPLPPRVHLPRSTPLASRCTTRLPSARRLPASTLPSWSSRRSISRPT